MTTETRRQLIALANLHRMTRKDMVSALRELGLQPTHLGERTRGDILRHIAVWLTPTVVWREVGRQQELAAEVDRRAKR
jgi:hypothetical protein